MSPDDILYLEKAFAEAETCAEEGYFPVGAVIVRGNEVLGGGCNRNFHSSSGSQGGVYHAEMEALKDAVTKGIPVEKVVGAVLYSTREPCQMCDGLITRLGIERVVSAAPTAGKSLYSLWHDAALSLSRLRTGVLVDHEREMVERFFAERSGESSQ